eukprot:UN25855
MSERVLQALHGTEIADYEFAEEQWIEYKGKVALLKLKRQQCRKRLNGELRDKVLIEANVYNVDLQHTLTRLKKEMDEQLEHLELTLHDPEWLSKPAQTPPTNWHECAKDIKKYEDLTRVAEFRTFVIKCR